MNRKAAVLGTALVIGLFLLVGAFQDTSKMTFFSHFSLRAGVAG